MLKQLEILGKEVVPVEEAKLFLKIDHDDEDTLLAGLIRTARMAVEAYTSRSLILQKWQFTLNAGYAVSRSDPAYLSGHKSRGDRGIEMPRAPFVTLLGNPVLITDYGPKEITDFRIDTSGVVTRIHFGASAQNFLQGSGTLQLTFTAGYEDATCPEPLKMAILMIVAHLYEHRLAANDNPDLLNSFQEGILNLIKPYQIKRLA